MPRLCATLTTMTCIRVLVVDDAPDFLASAVQSLTRDFRLCVVGSAGDGGAAIELVEALDPDLVLMDVGMPGVNGFAATSAIKRRRPRTRVWLMSLHDDPGYRRHAALVGADHFLDKQTFQAAVGALLNEWDG